VDQQTISTEYASLGVTFTLLDHNTGLPIGSPRIAKVGTPTTAFEGCSAGDTPLPYLGLGQSFLTDGTSVGLEGDLLIEYSTPVAQASGLILDIDCRTSGGPPCEQWTITAYDTSGTPLDSVVIDGPADGPNPECNTPSQGFGDSQAFGWSLDVDSPLIGSILLRYTGAAPNVGLAFDNFSASSVPTPLGLVTTVNADTVCTGDQIELAVFPSGGFPPYSFQWQQELLPGQWFDLDTEQTQPVLIATTRRYRVVVTDASNDELAGAPLTVVADRTGLLCQASLLVSSFYNDRIVRYSFLSQQPEIFVGSGTGSLNGTSKIICGPDANIYASSQNNDRILRFDGGDGSFIDIFVAAGSGGLNAPIGLDFGPDGNLYVISNANHSVIRYNGTSGAFINVFVPNGSGLNGPTGLLWAPNDSLLICSLNSDKVLQFDQSGTYVGDFVAAGSGGLNGPRGLAFGPDGNLYVSEQFNDSVRRYNGTTGAFIDIFVSSGSGGLNRANDLAFGPDGILYVASFDNDLVLGYDGTTGAFLGALPSTPLNGPAWFAIGCQATATAVRDDRPPSVGLLVEPNVPNPFNPWTTIRFTLPTAGHVRVSVANVKGQIIASLLNRKLSEGRHIVDWNGETTGGGSAASGVYFVRVESRGMSATRKITLIR
jgi:streptogramin lyase